jgi:hypothetical protein
MEIDILSIDRKIRDLWIKSQENITKIENDIKEFEEIAEQENISLYVKKDINDKIKNLQEEREKLENLIKNENFYTMEFSELLENNKNKISKPKKISFMGKKEKNDTDYDISKDYFEILKKYNIDYKELEDITKKPKSNKKTCTYCKSQEFLLNSEQNTQICQTCGKQEERYYKSMSFKDITRVNMSSKYTYERRVHFKDCINQYQGKQNATVDEKVYEDLEIQFDLHGLLLGDKNTPKKTRFENITKEHILLFLKETGHSKHYEDVVLIYHKMTGKKVDDISHLETLLMEDFDKISDLYDKKYKFAGKIDRKSFINTQYVLFQLLRRHKYPCKKEDFNILKTLDRKSFHDEIVKDLFESLGFNFTPIF